MATALDLDSSARDDAFHRVVHHLEESGIDHEVVRHPPAFTAADEARDYGAPAHRVVKTIALRSGDADVLVAIPASERLDIHRVRQLLADPSARLATEEEMAVSFPGLEPGALPPFGGILPVPELIDRRLLSCTWVLANGGDHRHSLRVSPLAIVHLSRARVVDICEY